MSMKVSLTDLSLRLNNDPAGVHHNQMMDKLLHYQEQIESDPNGDPSTKSLLMEAFKHAKTILQKTNE